MPDVQLCNNIRGKSNDTMAASRIISSLRKVVSKPAVCLALMMPLMTKAKYKIEQNRLLMAAGHKSTQAGDMCTLLRKPSANDT
eukprot:scaffold492772_cov19-Prasinocladus_malaysianus.AAC.1